MWAKRLPSTRVEWLWDRFWAWMATPELERLWNRFWAWMATPEAGNLAEWVGAVGTTGALLLGLHLLRRDRERRRSSPSGSSICMEKLAIKAEPG